jgi:hypothetical protein
MSASDGVSINIPAHIVLKIDDEPEMKLTAFDPASESVVTRGTFPVIMPGENPPSWRGEILTVGYLRALLDGLNDEEHVVIATKDWYVNIEAVAKPDVNDDGLWSCLTFFPGTQFDSRQL